MSCNNTLHVRIKAYFVAPLNEIRRFKLPLSSTFEDFRAQVAKFYTEMKQVPDIQFQFIYLDDEKDWVRFNSDDEWQEAKCSGKNHVLRVKICQVGKNCAESTINVVCPKSSAFKIENAATPNSVPYCQGCNHEITKGTRYKCSTCSHFNLCSCCYAKRAELKNHDNSHAFAALCVQQQQPSHHQHHHHSYHPYYHQQSASNNNNTANNNPCNLTNMFQQLAARWLPRCPSQSAPASNTSTPASTPPIVTDEDDEEDDMMLDQELYKSVSSSSPSRCFKAELGTLETMGFVNSSLNESLLRQYDGNVQQVIEHLVKMYKK